MIIPKTFNERIKALNALKGSGSYIEFRFFTSDSVNPSDRWRAYVDGVEISNGGIIGSLSGLGNTPEEAVADIWTQIKGLTPYAPDEDHNNKWLVLNSWRENRRHVIWNNFMWEDVPVKLKT